MYLVENPVLQRELLVNLRMGRAFVLLFLYQALLGMVVYLAWPQDERVDMTANSAAVQKTRKLVDMFFLGQYILASMMAPSFAAATITGEKERKTYEMLLASPLRPSAIVLGKLLASLAHLAALIFASLPIVMLCLPLGGVSLYEVLTAYLALIVSVVTFGTISVACSSYFQRTAASLAVSYLLILPLALVGVLLWNALSGQLLPFRLLLSVTVLPAVGAAICIALYFNTSARLLHPPDVGSEGKEVVDLDQESQKAVGLVIQPTQFPDRLFAPAKRDDFLDDRANPVYDKETRSEIFSQGTLMLRLVIQVSMLLAIPLMAFCLYIVPKYAAWYIGYVVMFNMLVGPVFSAGSVTSERERETLDLLLTTTITPWQILWGKLLAGLRVSSVLTTFLLWPVLLACVMVNSYWTNLPAVGSYLVIVLMTCLSTAMIALFCSVVFKKTSMSLMTTYLVIIVMFCVPLAAAFFSETFFPNIAYRADIVTAMEKLRSEGKSSAEIAEGLAQQRLRSKRDDGRWIDGDVELALGRLDANRWVKRLGITSPFSAAFAIPLDVEPNREDASSPLPGDWLLFAFHMLFALALNGALLGLMIWLFNTRWRVSG